MTSSETLLSWC